MTLDSIYSLSTFEHQLVMYVTSGDKETFATAFDVATIPVVSHEQALAEERTKKLTSATPTLKAPSAGPPKSKAAGGMAEAASASATQKYAEQLLEYPDIKAYGTLLKSCAPVELSESETEYVVTAVKHIFKDHIVLQYDIKNTLPDTILENVTVVATPDDEDAFEEDFIIPAPKLPTDEPGVVYVAFKKAGSDIVPVASFTNHLKFTSKEIDPTTGEPEDSGYDDEYQVEDLELTGSDYVIPTFAGSFDHVWEQTGANGQEESETLQLSNMKSINGTYNFYLNFSVANTHSFTRCHGTTDLSPISPAPRGYRYRPQQQHTHAQAVRQDCLRRPCRCSDQDGLFQQDRCHY